jgi:hypothetical protein
MRSRTAPRAERFSVEDKDVGTPRFSPETRREHHLLKTPLWEYLRRVRLMVLLSVPIVYLCAIPFLLDLFVLLYQSICFPVGFLSSDYLIFDPVRLAYLKVIERIGCVYCSCANGLLAFVTEIVEVTEPHFCPIRRDRRLRQPHSRYPYFLPYGDALAYRRQVEDVSRAYGDLDVKP